MPPVELIGPPGVRYGWTGSTCSRDRRWWMPRLASTSPPVGPMKSSLILYGCPDASVENFVLADGIPDTWPPALHDGTFGRVRRPGVHLNAVPADRRRTRRRISQMTVGSDQLGLDVPGRAAVFRRGGSHQADHRGGRNRPSVRLPVLALSRWFRRNSSHMDCRYSGAYRSPPRPAMRWLAGCRPPTTNRRCRAAHR